MVLGFSLRFTTLCTAVLLCEQIQGAFSTQVRLGQIRVLHPDAAVRDYTIPELVAKRFETLEGPLRVSEEPWGEIRPRCLCVNLAVWSADGKHKALVVVEPPFGSEGLDDKDAGKVYDAAVKMNSNKVAS
eukprot:TRINITY_DN110550_c0_g1_i1.p1 TRINITY_DN110550_c0_g1~~TRINITY_DN110550_c0_g1_i1.p1  ORF type:complete len:130 (-),score=24.76 TRINITY_DN110550_c0_g1_i1:191-580(-)